MSPTHPPGRGPFAVLRRFVRPSPPLERCELCGLLVGEDHPHLLELASRKVACACAACAVLFSSPEASRFRRIPRQARRLAELLLPDELWGRLCVPINLVFFFHHSGSGKMMALYPSPAGATEALLPLDAWPALVELNPVLREMAPDVEALLVNRVEGAADCYLAPIDECFRLVGLIRRHWRGLSGGAEVWREVARFFARLRERSLGEAREGGGPCPT
jgi:hypothetical protein